MTRKVDPTLLRDGTDFIATETRVMHPGTDYDSRSLQHERRMLELYRKGAESDGALLQPLANSCWRAGSFEWKLHQDPAEVRSLWGEAACALAEGFERRRSGFEPSAEQLILGLHFSIGAQRFDVARTLAHATAAVPINSRAPRLARASRLLLEGYQLVVRALMEQNGEYARAAQQSLMEASKTDDCDWTKTLATGVTDWRGAEPEIVRALLNIIAGALDSRSSLRHDVTPVEGEAATINFGALLDSALSSLKQFTEAQINHHPKLYCWLPGVALCNLAASAGLSFDWLDQHEYSRLITTEQEAVATWPTR